MRQVEEKVTWIVISDSVFWYSYSTQEFLWEGEQFIVSITLEGMENG